MSESPKCPICGQPVDNGYHPVLARNTSKPNELAERRRCDQHLFQHEPRRTDNE
jgi:hypothetical protein